MKKLTEREEQIMKMLWSDGPLFVREMIDRWPEPKPHFNTVSTFVRIMETKGFVGHEVFGPTHRYYPVMTEKEYSRSALKDVIAHCFHNSMKSVVSALVQDEHLTADELRRLIDLIEQEDEK